MRRLIGVFLLVTTLAYALQERADPDQLRADVQAAMTKHRAAIRQLQDELEKVMRAVIKHAANNDEFGNLRALAESRERFLASGALPQEREVADGVAAYVEKRKASALTVVSALRAAIDREPNSDSLKTTLEKFIEEERAAIGLPSGQPPTGGDDSGSASRGKSRPPADPGGTKARATPNQPSEAAVRRAETKLLPLLFAVDYGSHPLSANTGKWVYRETSKALDDKVWDFWVVECFFDVGGGQQVVRTFDLATSGDSATTAGAVINAGIVQGMVRGYRANNKSAKKKGR